eukprot:1630196-Pyramimonas_sp.AAC.2
MPAKPLRSPTTTCCENLVNFSLEFQASRSGSPLHWYKTKGVTNNDEEAFQIVGIPGVEITPETQGQDGTVLKGDAKVLQGTLLDDGQVAQLEDEDEDLSLELAWGSFHNRFNMKNLKLRGADYTACGADWASFSPAFE